MPLSLSCVSIRIQADTAFGPSENSTQPGSGRGYLVARDAPLG